MALELILCSLLKSKKFVSSSADEKDWQSISKLIPGVTPKQCAKKWEELCQNSWLIKPPVKASEDVGELGLNAVVDYLLVSKDSEESSGEEDQNDVQNDETVGQINCKKEQEHNSKPSKLEDVIEQKKDLLLSSTKKLKPKPITPDGPNMVIHVCDESKNLKQDFSCPRDLLVKEMKYFAEYLSLEPQRWEEVDISVHCDVQIFDWLMHYAKRDVLASSDDAIPKLEANNVISILISSDFLRMDSLVTKCIHYCHENMSAILSTPCNMNCINDNLVTRISKLFNHTELDAVKDRKDKFRSKLFCKKIEEFVNGLSSSSSCPDNASTLFRCISCKKLLTTNSQSNVPCVLNRLNIDSRGKMSYGHMRDTSWDINDFLISLKEKLKSWRDVYWRLWGSVTVLYCYHCHNYLPCTELGHCRYHSQTAEYGEGDDSSIVGVYPCCLQKALRYDSLCVLSGCHVKDHIIEPRKHSIDCGKIENDTKDTKSSDDVISSQTDVGNCDQTKPDQSNPSVVNDPLIIKDLLAHRDVICLPFQRVTSARTSDLNVFLEDELLGNAKIPAGYAQKMSANAISAERKEANDPAALPPIRRSKTSISQRMPSSRRKTAILKSGCSTSTEDEEEEEDEVEENVKAPTRHFHRAKKKHSAESRQSSGFKWDPQRSQRWNQDAQREEDSKRMIEVMNAMAKLRCANNREKKPKGKDFPGGIFHKLDHQFRISSQPPSIKNQTSNTQLTTGSRSRRPVVKS